MKYRSLITSVCLMIGLVSAAAHAQTIPANAADERAIRALIASHASSSQQDDFANLVGGYQVDADLRRSDGEIVSGKAEIEKRYRDSLAGGPGRWRTLTRLTQSGFASCGRT